MRTSTDRNRAQRRSLPQISAEAFISPRDSAALTSLQQMPLLPQLVRKFNDVAGDRVAYLQNSAASVRCRPRQLPTLYRLLQEACEILDVPEPELFLQRGTLDHAHTAGVSRPFIVLTSAIVEDFTNEELLFVIGHELGHILFGLPSAAPALTLPRSDYHEAAHRRTRPRQGPGLAELQRE